MRILALLLIAVPLYAYGGGAIAVPVEGRWNTSIRRAICILPVKAKELV